MSTLKKLQTARVTLQASQLKKSGHNKFAGYQYFELGDFLPTVQKIFNELGLCGVVTFDRELAKLSIHDVEGGEPVVITSPMGSANLKGCHEVQNIGAVETYQRRYLWVTAMEIVEHDALDAVTGAEKRESAKSVAQSEFDGMDAETQEWMRSEAATIITMLRRNDVEGAGVHLESLKLDNDSMVAFWCLFDSEQRTMLGGYSAMSKASSLDELATAFNGLPKYAKPILETYKNKRKAALTQSDEGN